jgi:hypothetical protein
MKTLSSLGSSVVTLILIVGAGLGLSACSGVQLEPVTDDPVVDDVPKSVTSLVSATSVVSACPDNKHMNARAATNAINHLIEPCATVPGGKAHFSATLLPGGKIELAAPAGDPEGGVVPTCVLKGGLHHKVKLMHACTFDVQLEERKITTPDAAPK